MELKLGKTGVELAQVINSELQPQNFQTEQAQILAG